MILVTSRYFNCENKKAPEGAGESFYEKGR